MSLTKAEVLDLFVQHVDNTVIAERIKQMYQALAPAAQDVAYATIKDDVLAVFTGIHNALQAQDITINEAVASASDAITDINNAT